MAVKHSPVVKVMIYAAIAFILVVAGFLVWSFLGGSVPPEATLPVDKPPVEAPLADEPAPEPEPTPLPPVPTNFIVADEYWETAVFYLHPDGTLYKDTILFPDFPIGAKLYAPISGELHIAELTLTEDKTEDKSLWSRNLRIGEAIGKALPPGGENVGFYVMNYDLLDIGAKDGRMFVEKGQPFARVTDNTRIRFYGTVQPMLMIDLGTGLTEGIDESIECPREYVWAAIQLAEEK